MVGITGRKCILCQLAFGTVGIINKSLCHTVDTALQFIQRKLIYSTHYTFFYTQAHSRTHKLKAKQNQIHLNLVKFNQSENNSSLQTISQQQYTKSTINQYIFSVFQFLLFSLKAHYKISFNK